MHILPISRMSEQADPAAWFAEQVRFGIEKLEARGHGCAALLVDSIFSSDGIYADPQVF
ncbi:hypothetical protein ACU8V3_12965 [Cobetia marina]